VPFHAEGGDESLPRERSRPEAATRDEIPVFMVNYGKFPRETKEKPREVAMASG
jgi:hypothetical protein